MDESKQTQEQPGQQNTPKDYSRYMGTLNRIYGRNPNSKKKMLEDGIGSLKPGAQPPQKNPQDGKKDRSFWIVLAVIVLVFGAYWLLKTVLL